MSPENGIVFFADIPEEAQQQRWPCGAAAHLQHEYKPPDKIFWGEARNACLGAHDWWLIRQP